MLNNRSQYFNMHPYLEQRTDPNKCTRKHKKKYNFKINLRVIVTQVLMRLKSKKCRVQGPHHVGQNKCSTLNMTEGQVLVAIDRIRQQLFYLNDLLEKKQAKDVGVIVVIFSRKCNFLI
jgi:hypothetical protein